METVGESAHADLVSPTPHRAYAFLSPFGDDELAARPQSVPWGGMGGIVRPISAPVPMGFLAPAQRPASPLSRVTNPMVRDNHFRRGNAGADKNLQRLQRHSTYLGASSGSAVSASATAGAPAAVSAVSDH